MKIYVGGIYLTRCGLRVDIMEKREGYPNDKHPFKGRVIGRLSYAEDWQEDGQFGFDYESSLDLVDEHPICKCSLGKVLRG